MQRKIRTRYAPSPTGYFHIGGARTALFNYLFAKHNNGDFILRIEDTDVDRNVKNGIESQLNNLMWLGIQPDESPIKENPIYGKYIQSEKFNRYEELAYKLLQDNKAYYCFCSKQELDEQRKYCELNHLTPKYNRKCLHLSYNEIQTNLKNNVPYVIRLKIDDHALYEWDDLVRGKISINADAMTDPVILKSNKIAMYNFAVVIDDYDMDITHILRGEEHISNTPYQIAIKKALGFDNKSITYGHLSIITNQQGKKLSKRDTQLKQFIEDYKNLGYLPQAIINFLALLGWNPTNNNEIMDLNQMIQGFNILNVSKSPAMFDEEKLKWICAQHFKKMDNDEYLTFVKPFVTSNNYVYLNNQNLVLLLFKNQISYAKQIDLLINEYFSIQTNDQDLKLMVNEFIQEIKLIIPIFYDLVFKSNFSLDDIKKIINEIQVLTNLKGKNLYMPIRIISSLKTHGPELNTLLYLIGKEKILQNINKLKKYVE